MDTEWRGIGVVNWYRSLSAYLSVLIDAGLRLVFFDESQPCSGDIERRQRYRRMPWLEEAQA